MAAWLMGVEPTHSTLWIMNAEEQTKRNVGAVANIVTAPWYKEIFPKVLPDPARGWNQLNLYQRSGPESTGGERADPSLAGSGIIGAYQGLHPSHIICDDLTNQDDLLSPATMSKQRQQVRGVIDDRLERDMKDPCIANGIKVICTRWGEDDLVPTFESMGFKVHVYPIEGEYPWPPGRFLFPEKWMDEEIEAKKKRKDSAETEQEDFHYTPNMFQMTYMCNPQAAEGNLVLRKWFRYYRTRPQEHELTMHAMSWDFSTGAGADYTAWMYGAYRDPNVVALDGGMDKLTSERKKELMLRLHDIYQPDVHCVHWNTDSADFIAMLESTTRLPLNIQKFGNASKPERLSAQSWWIEVGRFWLPDPKEHSFAQITVDQCAAFTQRGSTAKNDDLADTLTGLLAYYSEKRLGRRKRASKARKVGYKDANKGRLMAPELPGLTDARSYWKVL